jgi:hypothetical protein
MQLRVSFEYGAGVCLWADDAAARARWDSAVTLGELPLPVEVAAQGEQLMAEFDAAFVDDDTVFIARWSAVEQAEFHARAAAWTERVRGALALHGIEVAPYEVEPEPTESGAEFAGCVIACFTDEAARAAVDRAEAASTGWAEAAVWNGDIFALRASERSPAELLAKLEGVPGFVAGWWQRREFATAGAMIEGDPEDHALVCLRERNATGFVNFLSWLGVERLHLTADLVAFDWRPTPAHRRVRATGSWWEWFSFARNAGKALRGERPSASYLRAERERLFWQWTHGGRRDGWPANFAEAATCLGLRRESFLRWTK